MFSTLYNLLCLDRKYLVYNLVARNTRLRYRKSYLGAFWTVLIPASQAIIYFFIFKFVMKVQIQNYLLFVLSGLIPWTFFSSAIISSMESLVGNHGILNKVPIPPYAFPLAEVLTAIINLAAALPVLIGVILFTGASISWTILLLPLLIGFLALQAYAIGLMLSYFYVYFRDLRHFVVIVLQIWFYLTPILYKAEMVPPEAQAYLGFNPVGKIFENIHLTVMGAPSINPQSLLESLAWSFVLLVIAVWVSQRFNSQVVEMV